MGHQGVILAIAGSEQVPLPGMPEGVRTTEREPIQPPLMNVWDGGPSADQLSFAADQMVLQQLASEPAQLAFLPDPAIWEVIDSPKRQAPAGRLGRRRARNGITPGQGSFF